MKAIWCWLVIVALGVTGFAWQVRAGTVNTQGMFDGVLVADAQETRIAAAFDKKKDDQKKEKCEGCQSKKQGSKSGVGFFVGPMVKWEALDLDKLDPITDNRNINSFPNSLWLYGGQAGLIFNDLRIGAYGFAGSEEEWDRVHGDKRFAGIWMSGYGGLVEYNRPINCRIGFLLGAMIGGGEITLSARGRDLDNEACHNKYKRYTRDGNYFEAAPYLGAWVALTKWCWLEVNAGYSFLSMDRSDFKIGYHDWVDMRNMMDDEFNGGFMTVVKLNFGHNPRLELN